MPNICGYTMKIVGMKKDRDKFMKLMSDYGLKNHFLENV